MEQNTYKNGIMEYLEKINNDEILKKIYTVTKTYYENCMEGKKKTIY